MTAYSLRADIYFAVANHKVVLLDLKADRYFCLPPKADAAFQELVTTGLASGACLDALLPLVVAGMLVETGEVSTFSTTNVAPATSSLLDSLSTKIPPMAFLGALCAQAGAMLDLRRRPLHAIIADLKRHKQQSTSPIYRLTPDIMSAFLATRRVIATQDRCLRWSLATMTFLTRRHISAQLVLGVKAAPFRAHAWVQSGAVVVNDNLDYVRSYAPILVV